MQNTVDINNAFTFTSSTGAMLFYRDYVPAQESKTVPMLCLHGFMRNSRDFSDLGRLLSASGTRVIAPDIRGRGFSQRYSDVKDYHYDLVLQDVRDLLDHLKLSNVVVLGIALGGLIAMDLAAETPSRVGGIVLNDLGTEIGEQSSKRMAKNADGGDYTYEEAVARMKSNFGETYPNLNNAQWEDLTLRAYREVKPGRYARDFDQLTLVDAQRMKAERPDAWPHFLATKHIPVALIRGERSDFFTEDCAERMVKAHPNAVLTTVKERGHPPLLDEPDALAAIHALLDRVAAS